MIEKFTEIINPQIIILIGGVLAILGAYLASVKSNIETRKAEQAIIESKEIANKNVELSLASHQFSLANKELIEQNLEYARIQKSLLDNNLELTDKVNQKTIEINNFVTGGDSYCLFEVFFDVMSKKPQFVLRHKGKTVLRNVSITIHDLARRVYMLEHLAKNDNNSPLIPDILKNTIYGLSYPSQYPNSLVHISIPVEENQNDLKLHIWVYLENGNLFETLEVKNFKNDNRVYELELKKGDIILEKH